MHRACNTEGYCENNETDSIVDSNDGKEDVGKLTFSLILTNDHKGCRRSGCGRNCAEHQRRRSVDNVLGKELAKSDKRKVDDERRNESLENTDNGCLFAYLLKLTDAEFVTDCKRDKAQSNLRKDVVAFDRFGICKAQPFNAGERCELTEAIGADEDTCNKITGNGGKLEFFNKTREQKARGHCYTYWHQSFQIIHLTFIYLNKKS